MMLSTVSVGQYLTRRDGLYCHADAAQDANLANSSMLWLRNKILVDGIQIPCAMLGKLTRHEP